MTGRTIILLHGFASSGQSTKANYFRDRFKSHPEAAFHAIDFNPTPRDFEYMTVSGMINRLRQYVLDRGIEQMALIGSSMGALVAVHYAYRFGAVSKLMLLAPALCYQPRGLGGSDFDAWQQAGVVQFPHYAFEREVPLRFDLELDGALYRRPLPPVAPTLILHGRHDPVVPIEESQDYAARFGARLIELEAEHTLNDQLELIWEQVESFLLS